MTEHLIAPHGGTLVDLMVDDERAAKLKELGQTYDIHVFPDQHHGYRLPDYIKLTLDFVDKHAEKQAAGTRQ